MLGPQDNGTASTQAVIYARVSSAAQMKRGDGIGSQLTRCKEYARYKGLEVIRTFEDDASGSLTSRPGMVDMLSFLKTHRGAEPIIVIIDDISRLARGMEAHLQLRSAIGEAGGLLRSPTIEFGEDSDSILVENMLASVSQHQRQKNAEQTTNRMRARLMNGYYCLSRPIGYLYRKAPGQGSLLVRDEPCASIIQEALEGFAAGRFDSQVEVKRFLEGQPDFPKDLPNGKIRHQRIKDILTRVTYAGYIEHPDWGVSLRKGHHEGLIDLATFEKIQNRLNEGARAPARKDLNEDFILRGFVCCADCSRPLTACWSKSKTGKKHPYYLCFTKGCDSYRKSIRRDQIEGDFGKIVRALQPTPSLFKIARAMFEDVWNQRLAFAKEDKASLQRKIKTIDSKIETLVDRIVDADNTSIASAYEKKIAGLEKERLLIAEKQAKSGAPLHAYDEMFELAMQFLANPWKLWESGQSHLRRMVLRLAFAERMSYHREKGFSNPKKAIPFNMLGGIEMGKCEMAHPGRFELPTPRFVVWCSIQLSYGCIARRAIGPGKAAW
jgi:site-specific DNA recombinase